MKTLSVDHLLGIKNLHKEEIARLKDFQSKLSTKMIGETLEQHCQMVFDLRQADGCFPNAQLLKDNDVVNGTKGDFIFKDYDEEVMKSFQLCWK